MKQSRLSLESLAVESFPTTAAPRDARGTQAPDGCVCLAPPCVCSAGPDCTTRA